MKPSSDSHTIQFSAHLVLDTYCTQCAHFVPVEDKAIGEAIFIYMCEVPSLVEGHPILCPLIVEHMAPTGAAIAFILWTD